MTSNPLSAAMAQLGHAIRQPNTQPDAALMGAFVRDRSEEAAAELVRRYGPMVYGVCRRVYASEAEDAFQAVWLVFSRNASRVQPFSAVGQWLYGVAVKVATKARSQNLTRRQRLMSFARSENDYDQQTDPLLTAVLDEELARLPDKFRLPLLLCDLGYKTRVEAAAALGWPEGTVATRLNQGRERLAVQLRRRGITLSAMGVASALAAPTILAQVPTALSLSAVKIISGSSAISPTIVPLANIAGISMNQKSMMLIALGLLAAVSLTVAGMRFFGPGDFDKPNESKMVAGDTTFSEWRLKSVQKDHGQMVYDAAFSQDGKMFATAGADGTVIVWDSASLSVARKIEVVKNLPPAAPANVPAFDPSKGPMQTSPDQRMREAGSSPPGMTLRFAADGQLRVGYTNEKGLPEFAGFDAFTGVLSGVGVRSDDVVKVLNRGTKGLAFSRADGTELPLETPGRDATKPPGFDGVFDTAVSPDGKLVAVNQWSVDRGSYLRLCDAVTGKSVVERPLFPPGDTPPRGLAFSPDGQRLAATTIAGRLAVFTAPDWSESYRNVDKLIRSNDVLAFTPDSRQLLTTGWREVRNTNWIGMLRSTVTHREVWVRDAKNGKIVQTLPLRTPTALNTANAATVAGIGMEVSKLTVSPNGRMMLVTLGNPQRGWPMVSAGEQAAMAAAGEVRIYVRDEIKPALQPPKVEKKPNPTDEVERNQDLWVWQQRRFAMTTGRIGSVAFFADGHSLLVGEDDHLTRWQLTDSDTKPLWRMKQDVMQGQGVTAAIAPGDRVAATINQSLTWFDSKTGKKTLDPTETFENGSIRAVGFSPDGKRVAMTDGRKLTVKQLGNPGEVGFGPMDDSFPGPAAVSWAPDGKRLVFLPNVKVDPTWPGNGAKQPDPMKATHFIAQVWGAGSGEPMVLLKHGPAKITAAVWSLDGKRIFTADEAGEVVIWDAITFKEQKRLKLSGSVRTIAVRPDGKRFAAGVDVQEPGKIDGKIAPPKKSQILIYSEWEPDNWLSSSRIELEKNDVVNVVAFSPDGKMMVAGTDNGLQVWDRTKLAPK